MVVCVGGVGSGKSLLLSTLTSPSSSSTSSSTSSFPPDTSLVPTVGVNLYTLPSPGGGITIRELGGALAPAWPSHLAGETRLLYLVDSCDLHSCGLVATQLVALMALLEDTAARENRVGRLCIVWTKVDRSSSQVAKYRGLLLLPSLIQHSTLVVTEVQWGAGTGAGLQGVREWVTAASMA